MNSVVIEDYKYILDDDDLTAGVEVVDTNKSSYGEILETIIVDNITYTVTNMIGCFNNCTNLTEAPKIPDNVIYMYECFNNCFSLIRAPELPPGIIDIDRCFANCSSLIYPPSEIPSSVNNMSRCFMACKRLTGTIIIHTKPSEFAIPFSLTGQISLITVDDESTGELYNFWKNQADLPSHVTVAEDIPTDTEFTVGDYRYRKNQRLSLAVKVIDKTKTSYGAIKNTIIIGNNHDYKTKSMIECFANCKSLIESPDITNLTKIVSMDGCFLGCEALTYAPELPESVVFLDACFMECTYLQSPPSKIPQNVMSMSQCFQGCRFIINPPDMSKATLVEKMNSCFAWCSSLIAAPVIPALVEDMRYCFAWCTSLRDNIIVRNDIDIEKTSNIFYMVGEEQLHNIYIVNGTGWKHISDVWRQIVENTNNPRIHFEADDHTPPKAILKLTRTDESGKASQTDTWVKIEIESQIYTDYIPIGRTDPTVVSERFVRDSDIEFTPAGEGRERGPYNLEDGEQHTITYTINDGYRTTTVTATLSRVMALLDFLGTGGQDGYIDIPGMGLAIGTIATRNGLAIQFPTTIGDELLPATKKTDVYTLTTDTEFDPEKEYYEKDGDNYVLTEDTEFIDGTEYYENREAIDLDNYQLVIGRYNIKDEDKVFIIGNGNENKRSNIFTIDWNGNTKMQGRATTVDMTEEEIIIFINELRGN